MKKVYTDAQLKAKAAIVFENNVTCKEVQAFKDGNIFFADQANAITNHKRETKLEPVLIKRESLEKPKAKRKAPAKKKTKEVESPEAPKEQEEEVVENTAEVEGTGDTDQETTNE